MRRNLLALSVLFTILAGAALAQNFVSVRRGHFFLPSRTLFHLRPNFFVNPFFYGGGFYYPPPVLFSPSITQPFRSPGIYRLDLNSPPRTEVIQANSSDLIFKVEPSRALIYVDGKLIGSARDFATERDRYKLLEGEYDLRIEYPGYQPFDTRMQVVPNRTLHLDIELQAVPGKRK